jgi:hypothetical protein
LSAVKLVEEDEGDDEGDDEDDDSSSGEGDEEDDDSSTGEGDSSSGRTVNSSSSLDDSWSEEDIANDGNDDILDILDILDNGDDMLLYIRNIFYILATFY